MTSLDKDMIEQLLKEDAAAPKRGGGRTKTDPTIDRSITNWYKLNHHLCSSVCPHRLDPSNPTRSNPATDPSPTNMGEACWNPDCVDPRDKATDRGANIVVELKGGEFVCRYCFLDGYLLEDA